MSSTSIAPALSSPLRAAHGRLTAAALVTPDPVPGELVDKTDKPTSGVLVSQALVHGLEACVAENQFPWETMRQMCIELVDTFGSPRVTWENDDGISDPAKRLGLSALYLQLAIKLNASKRSAVDNPLVLASDKSFSSPCPEALILFMEGITSSSVSNPKQDPPAVSSSAPVDKKGGKAAPAAASSTTSSQITGRDVLFALASLLREADPLWLEGYEYDYIYDLHASLARNFSAYSDSCCIKSIPSTSNSELNVAIGSVSALWILHTGKDASKATTRGLSKRKPESGVFADVIGYFLIGPASAGNSKNSPLLTKIELPLWTIRNWERQLIILRDSIRRSRENNTGDQIEAVIPESVEILLSIYHTFKPRADENSVIATPSKSGNTLSVEFREISENKICSVAIGDALFSSLASCLSFKTGCLDLSDTNACAFLWFCLQ